MKRNYFLIVSAVTLMAVTTSVYAKGLIDKDYMVGSCDDTFDIFTTGAARLRLTPTGTYNKNMDCTVTVSTLSTSRLMFYFKNMDIEWGSDCEYDWLELHDGETTDAPTLAGSKKLCGTTYPSGVFQTSDGYLTLRFVSDNSNQNSGFDMVITSFHDGLCMGYEHDCDNGHCVDHNVLCNGFNPCGDHSDCPVSVGVIVGAVIGSVILVAVLTIVIVVVRRRRRFLVISGQPTTFTSPTIATVSNVMPTGYNQPVPSQYVIQPPPYSAGPPRYT